MPPMGDVLLQRLARSAEAKLRWEGSALRTGMGWRSMTESELARFLYDSRRPGSPFTYIQYFNIARAVIANARDAAILQNNPDMSPFVLRKAPGQSLSMPAWEYRTVVVGRDNYGNEVWSTIVYIYSDKALTGQQIQDEALRQYQAPTAPMGYVPSGPQSAGSVVTVDAYIVSAGKR